MTCLEAAASSSVSCGRTHWRVRGLMLTTLSLVIGFAFACASRAPRQYRSLAAAARSVPRDCRTLYTIDGVLQSDSVAVYSLPDSTVRRIEVVRGTGLDRCPLILVSTRP